MKSIRVGRPPFMQRTWLWFFVRFFHRSSFLVVVVANHNILFFASSVSERQHGIPYIYDSNFNLARFCPNCPSECRMRYNKSQTLSSVVANRIFSMESSTRYCWIAPHDILGAVRCSPLFMWPWNERNMQNVCLHFTKKILLNARAVNRTQQIRPHHRLRCRILYI